MWWLKRLHGVDLYVDAITRVPRVLGNDEFKGFAAAANRIDWNSLVERCQFAPFVKGQPQQVDIGDLGMCDDCIGFEHWKDADILSPKVMTRSFTKLAKDG